MLVGPLREGTSERKHGNGTVETNEEATAYIKDLDMFLCVKSVDDSRAVLSLGMMCEKMGYSYS